MAIYRCKAVPRLPSHEVRVRKMASLSQQEKQQLVRELADSLADETEIERIVVFGSFLNRDDPTDMDVAIFQNSRQAYLPLALKYRRKTRHLAKRIALDIIPLRPDCRGGAMLQEIARGKVIYERRG